MFSAPGIFYFNTPSDFIFDHDWKLDHNKISNLKNHHLVIVDFSSEHYGPNGLDHVYHALDQQEINFLLLSHDLNDHQKFPRMFFYPYWFYQTKNKILKYYQVDKGIKTYKISCINRQPRVHRVLNWFYLEKKSYFDQCYFSMYRAEEFENNWYRLDDISIDNSIAEYWNQKSNTFKSFTKVVPGDALFDIDIPAYRDSYINLITETSVLDRLFITEKTWKAVAVGQLFVVYGNPKSIEYLRAQGVDVFDDIIDHEYYDTELDPHQRLSKLHQVIDRLIAQDLQHIWESTYHRRCKNQDKFLSGEFDKKYKHSIEQAIYNR